MMIADDSDDSHLREPAMCSDKPWINSIDDSDHYNSSRNCGDQYQ